MKKTIAPITGKSEVYEEPFTAEQARGDYYCSPDCEACYFDWALREWVWETKFFAPHMSEERKAGWVTVKVCPVCRVHLGTNEETGVPYRSYIVE